MTISFDVIDSNRNQIRDCFVVHYQVEALQSDIRVGQKCISGG